MKKTIIFMILCIIILGIVSCSEENNSTNTHIFIDGENGTVGTFSYDRYFKRIERYGGLRKDPNEFVNIIETKVKTKEKAIELAKNEITESELFSTEYNKIDVYYDKKTRMWAIHFYLDYVIAGGGQMVFIDSKGITKLFIYGE